MATQSLYRRYRPRRFSELKGQDHIAQALRTSVAEGREGQAYLFSGPRGTGKTSTARIMAKVLNCENPQNGEPCCECSSCLAVEQGTSYDVHELDAASNNGVDAMRDLIDKASLGTPGRHKVYILDEVHMLSKGAEAALLKTLEEPPPHVVFVLATTDPQKMSDTIRSRTQHLQFHLLAADVLHEHVRWVADDAGLTVSDEAIEQVISAGAGSPRDTLSALELASNSGGAIGETIELHEYAEAMIDHDPGRGLRFVAHAVSRGRDPRTITEELVGYLRNGFLSLMAPELVQLPSHRIEALADVARRTGAADLVRGIEHLGDALTEMRNAPDPRVLLDVATVRLTSVDAGDDISALVARIERVERRLADGSPATAETAPAPASARQAGPGTPAPPTSEEPPVDRSTGRTKLGTRAGAAGRPDGAESGTAAHAGAAVAVTPEPEVTEESPGASSGEPAHDEAPPPSTPAAPSAPITASDWETVRPQLRGMARAVFSPATLVSAREGAVTLGLPNDTHRAKCEQHRNIVEEALAAHAGTAVAVELVVDPGEAGGEHAGGGGGAGEVRTAAPPEAVDGGRSGAGAGRTTRGALAEDPAPYAMATHAAAEPMAPEAQHLRVVPDSVENAPGEAASAGRAIAEHARTQPPPPDPDDELQTVADTLPHDDDVDLDGLVDAPPESVQTPVDRLAEAFPGSELIDDPG